MSKTAVIISSPFQALCALDALSEYGSGDIVFYTIEDEQNTGKIKLLLSDYGYELIVLPQGNNTIKWYLNNYKKGRYDNIIVGDVFSYPLLILASIFSKWKSKVVYVDDGNSTLLINADLLPPHVSSVKWKLVSFFCRCKNLRRCLYTIYPIERYDNMDIVHHSLQSLLKCDDKEFRQEGVYIIGTNTSAVGADLEKYKITLKSIVNYYIEKEPVYYCPHRRDLNNYDDYCEEIGLKVYDTQVSVEYDFVKSGLYPRIIIGFGSTALYTLRKMFPLTEIYNVNIERNDERINHCYSYISELFSKEGIASCMMDKWKG